MSSSTPIQTTTPPPDKALVLRRRAETARLGDAIAELAARIQAATYVRAARGEGSAAFDRRYISGLGATPDWQGATMEHPGSIRPRSNAGRRDAPPGKCPVICWTLH